MARDDQHRGGRIRDLARQRGSALTELVQLFSTRRHPSITDLILNIAGTLVGIALASSWQGAGAVNAQRPASAPSPKQDP